MKVLVTGGAGFVGSHLAKRLIEAGEEVSIVDNLCDYYSPRLKRARLEIFLKGLPFSFYDTDIADFDGLKEIFSRHKFQRVYHLAAQAGVAYSQTHPDIYGRTNVVGTLNLLRLSVESGIGHFVFASSSSVYGQAEKYPVLETDSTAKPLSLYAATKIAGEAMLHAYCHSAGLKGTAFRFFNAYGPWARPDAALFIFTQRILAGRPVDVYDFGNAERDFTYIGDIVGGVMKAERQAGRFEVFNLGISHPVVVRHYLDVLEQTLGRKAQRNYLPARPIDIPKSHADITKARKLLGFEPEVAVERGVTEFVDWYKRFEVELNLSEL